MIIGKLSDLYRYKGIAKNIDTAINFIETHNLLDLPKGKTIVDGDNVFINRDTYVARPLEECFFENHENYMDMQIVLKGKEGFGYTHITNPSLKVISKYNPEKDVTKYEYNPEGAVFHVLEEGFALVYTEDVHLAKLDVDGNTVEKAVIKIKIEK